MTNEQREAIETMQHWIEYEKEHKNEINKADELIHIQEIVLSLIKEQQEKMDKKDKQIDLMARAIDNYGSQLVINTFKNKEHVKQYFAELVEKE